MTSGRVERWSGIEKEIGIEVVGMGRVGAGRFGYRDHFPPIRYARLGLKNKRNVQILLERLLGREDVADVLVGLRQALFAALTHQLATHE